MSHLVTPRYRTHLVLTLFGGGRTKGSVCDPVYFSCCLYRAERLAAMFSISVDEIVIIVVPETGAAIYHVPPEDAEVGLRIGRLGLSLLQFVNGASFLGGLPSSIRL